jgi:copper chaperone CopZ
MRGKISFCVAVPVCCLLLVLAGMSQAQSVRVAVLNIRTCTCDASAEQVRTLLDEQEGVMEVDIDIGRHMVTVTYQEDLITMDDMEKILADNDFAVHGEPFFLQ